ncbi:MAG: hypothetical protein R3F34_07860 [Planctomycetota bacterium]
MVEQLGYALRALGRSTEASRLLEPFARAWSDRADTRFLAALLAMDQGHVDRARRGFLRCLELRGHAPRRRRARPGASTIAPAHNLGVIAEVQCDGRGALVVRARPAVRSVAPREPRAGLERLAARTSA